jgi:hypothetical protein
LSGWVNSRRNAPGWPFDAHREAEPDVLHKITKGTKKAEDWRLRFFDRINGIYRIYTRQLRRAEMWSRVLTRIPLSRDWRRGEN